jgi:phosphate transport system substrate-binding protein
VQQSVKSPNGIGYVSLAFTGGVHTVSYNGVPCTLRNAKSGQYGGVRNFFMVTRGPATGATKSWINWIQKNRDAQKIVATDWVPLV